MFADIISLIYYTIEAYKKPQWIELLTLQLFNEFIVKKPLISNSYVTDIRCVSCSVRLECVHYFFM